MSSDVRLTLCDMFRVCIVSRNHVITLLYFNCCSLSLILLWLKLNTFCASLGQNSGIFGPNVPFTCKAAFFLKYAKQIYM